MGFTPRRVPRVDACHRTLTLSPSVALRATRDSIKWRTIWDVVGFRQELSDRPIPPLGPGREGGPLEALEFNDALDDDAPDGPEGDESGRASSGGQDDEEVMGGDSTGVTEEPDPFGDDLLVGAITPAH